MAIDREAAKAAGYSDAEIDAFEASESKKETEAKPSEYVPNPPAPAGTIPEVSQAAGGAAASLLSAGNFIGNNLGTIAGIGGAALSAPFIKDVVTSMSKGGSAQPVAPTIQGSGKVLSTPTAGPVAPTAGGALQTLGQSAVLPAALSMPYMGAAMEQSKIRANPVAPEYINNPYAMMTRGEAPTQGAAGAMNTRSALMNQQYGGLNEEEKSILNDDRIQQAVRLKAMSKIR